MKARYIPQKPILTGLFTGFIATLLQLTSGLSLGILYLNNYEDIYIEGALILTSTVGLFFNIKSMHDLCYGCIGRYLVNNHFYLSVSPSYKYIHKQYPFLDNIKYIYEYPLSSIGFIETYDQVKASI